MTTILKILLISALSLSSCSSLWHYNRAIKKDPSIVKTDTLIVEKEVEGSIVGTDTAEVNNDSIWIKAVGLGKISLDYKIKVQSVTNVTDVDPPKSKTEVRQKERTERKKEKTKQAEIKYKYKTVKVQENNFNLLYIGIAIGLSISFLIYRLWKRIFG